MRPGLTSLNGSVIRVCALLGVGSLRYECVWVMGALGTVGSTTGKQINPCHNPFY